MIINIFSSNYNAIFLNDLLINNRIQFLIKIKNQILKIKERKERISFFP